MKGTTLPILTPKLAVFKFKPGATLKANCPYAAPESRMAAANTNNLFFVFLSLWFIIWI